jgi:hypothetical protein
MIDKTQLVLVNPPPSQPPGMFKRLAQAVSVALSGGYFTPEQPATPQQPETKGRQFDYPAGYNLYYQPRRDSGLTFETLRNFADGYDIMRLIIETRKDQIAGFEWSIVPADEPGKAPGSAPTKATPEQQKQIEQVTEFLKYPDKRLPWHTWIRAVLEDLFVLDAIAIWPTFNGKIPHALERMDAGTLKLVIDEQGRIPEPPWPAYQQNIKGVVTSEYTREELCYFMRNPRNNKVYGFSPVEQVLMTVNIALRREISQLQYFTEGNVPEAIAGVPETWDSSTIAQFQKWWDTLMEGDTAARRHLKFIPGDASKVQMLRTSEDMLKTVFDEWLVRIICYAFSTSPTPFIQQVNRSVGETVQDVANEEGLVPMLDFLREMMNFIIRNVMRLPGVQFRWNLQEDVDPATQKEIDVAYMEHGVYSIDDVRARKGLEPLGVPPMIWTSGGPVPVSMFIDGTAPNQRPPPAPTDPFGDPLDPDDPDAEEDPEADPENKEGPPKPPAQKKEVGARSASPFRYGKSLASQTASRNRRGGRHLRSR